MGLFDDILQPEQTQPQPQTGALSHSSSLAEWAKAGGRALLEPGNMINRGIETASNVVGRAFGVRPEDNPVSRWQRDVVRAGEGIQRNDLGKDEGWAKEHPVQNFVQEQVEGALPYIELGIVPGGQVALPAIAAASTHAKSTNKLMDEGMDSDEAMLRATPGALTEGALFGAMHKAKNLVMGGSKFFDAAGNEVAAGTDGALAKFVPGKAYDLLKTEGEGLTSGIRNGLANRLENAPNGLLSRVGREAAFVGPYLHGQGEAVQAAELGAGAIIPEEYQQAHGYDPSKGFGENLLEMGKTQIKGLGTSMLVGGAFGAMAPNEVKRNDLYNRSVVAKMALDQINKAKDVATDVVGEAVERTQNDMAQQEAVRAAQKENEYQSSLERIKPLIQPNTLSDEHVGVLNDILANSTSPEVQGEAGKLLDQAQKLRQKQEHQEITNTIKQDKLNEQVQQRTKDQIEKQQQEHLDATQEAHDDLLSHRDEHVKLTQRLEQLKAKQDETEDPARKKALGTQIEHAQADIHHLEGKAVESAKSYTLRIMDSFNTFKEYAAHMVERFGGFIKKHLLSIWNYAKTTLASERGSFSWAEGKDKLPPKTNSDNVKLTPSDDYEEQIENVHRVRREIDPEQHPVFNELLSMDGITDTFDKDETMGEWLRSNDLSDWIYDMGQEDAITKYNLIGKLDADEDPRVIAYANDLVKQYYKERKDLEQNTSITRQSNEGSLFDQFSFEEANKPIVPNNQGYADVPYTRIFGLSSRGGSKIGDALHFPESQRIPRLMQAFPGMSEVEAKRLADMYAKANSNFGDATVEGSKAWNIATQAEKEFAKYLVEKPKPTMEWNEAPKEETLEFDLTDKQPQRDSRITASFDEGPKPKRVPTKEEQQKIEDNRLKHDLFKNEPETEDDKETQVTNNRLEAELRVWAEKEVDAELKADKQKVSSEERRQMVDERFQKFLRDKGIDEDGEDFDWTSEADKHFEDTYAAKQPKRASEYPEWDQHKGQVGMRSDIKLEDTTGGLKYVKKMESLAFDRYNADHLEQRDERKGNAYDAQKKAELLRHLEDIQKENEEFLRTVAKDVSANKNLMESRKDDKVSADQVVPWMFEQLALDGYDVRSIYDQIFKGTKDSFKTVKEIPQKLFDMLEASETDKEAKADYDGKEALTKEDYDWLNNKLKQFKIEPEKILDKLGESDTVTVDTVKYVLDLADKMTKGELLKNLALVKSFMKDPQKYMDFVWNTVAEGDATPETNMKGYRKAFEAEFEKAHTATAGFLKDMFNRIVENRNLPANERVEDIGFDSGPKVTGKVISKETKGLTPKESQKLEEKRIKQQFDDLDDVVEFNKSQSALVRVFYDAMDKLASTKGDIDTKTIVRLMETELVKEDKTSPERVAFDKLKKDNKLDEMVSKLLGGSIVTDPGEFSENYSKPDELRGEAKGQKTSEYNATEHNEAQRDLNQLGQPSEDTHIDPFTEGRKNIATLNIENDQLQKWYRPAQMYDLHELAKRTLPDYAKSNITKETDALVEQRAAAYREAAKHDEFARFIERYKRMRDLNEAPNKNGVSAEEFAKTKAETTALLERMAIQGAEMRKALKGTREEWYEKADKLAYKITKNMARARFFLVRKVIDQSNVVNRKWFEDYSNKLKDQLGGMEIKPEQLYDIYVKTGADVARFQSEINRITDANWQSQIDKAYAEAENYFAYQTKEGADKTDAAQESTRLANSILSSRLKDTEKELYQDLVDGKTNNGRPIEETYPIALRSKLEAMKKVEERIKALGYEKGSEKADKAADLQRIKDDIARVMGDKASQEVATLADHIRPKDTLTPDEQAVQDRYPGVKVIGLRNKIVTFFFDKVAKLFDADLILVNADNDFHGRYLPGEGKPKIIVNVNSSKGMSRVFAHELFHHVLNKVSPEGYKAFRESLKDAVDEAKWEEAVVRIGKQLYPQDKYPGFTEQTFKDILTNEFNANPQGSFYSGGALRFQREDKELPRNYYTKKSEGNFTTNPLNNKSSDYTNGELGAQKSLGSAIESDKFYPDSEARDAIENELYAEIFSQAINQKSFWDALGKTVEGRGIAAKTIVKMAEQAVKAMNLLSGRTKDQMNNTLIQDMVKDWTGLSFVAKRLEDGTIVREPHFEGGMNQILIDMLTEAKDSTKLRDNKERPFTAGEAADELKQGAEWLYNEGKIKLNKTYNKVFPDGSKSKKEVISSLEKFVGTVKDFIKKHKPQGWFADYHTDEDIVALANTILHGGNKELQEARIKVSERFKDAFKGMNEDQLEELHDKVVRKHDKDFFDALPQAQKDAFEEMNKIAKKIHKNLVEAGILKEGQEREHHYGQSIRWLFNGEVLDDSPDFMLRDDLSQLTRDDRFTKMKATDTTKQIKARGLKYATIDPLRMFEKYVEDTTALIRLKEFLNKGQEKGWIKQFNNEQEAAKAGMVSVPDQSLKVVHQFLLGEEGSKVYRIKMADGTYHNIGGNEMRFTDEQSANAQLRELGGEGEIEAVPSNYAYRALDFYRVFTESRTDLGDLGEAWDIDPDSERTFTDKKTADDYAASINKEGSRAKVTPVFKDVPPNVTSNYYFHKDLAHLMNVVLSKDKIRSSTIGSKIMGLKNAATTIELALSGFHAFTIGQELMASYAAWEKGRSKLDDGKFGLGAFNIVKAQRETREFNELIHKVILDPSYAATVEGKAELKRLLGTDNADAIDIYTKYFNHGGMLSQDPSLRSGVSAWGHVRYTEDGRHFSPKALIDSFHETLEKQRLEHPNSKIIAFSKAAIHHAMITPTAWLMEEGIPRIKFAAFAREYTLKLDKAQRKGLELSDDLRNEIARDTMKFVEDRFGEVNWKNMWLNKTNKSALQFLFRSFTWVAGSWKALAKAGVDIAKMGWFRLKGEKYELTEKGYWGMAAVASHVMTAAAISAIYMGLSAFASDEQETDESVPLLTRLLFPRVDPYDNTKRITIPSYVTEAFKIISHLGFMGNKVEPWKLVSGRFNSLLSDITDILRNEDFRGVSIRDPEDGLIGQGYSVVKHMIPMPIIFSNIGKIYEAEGISANMAAGAVGLSDAPASAKRSKAANVAFDLSRREYKGKEITEEDMDLKDELKQAMNAYSKGDKSKVDALLHEGRISERQYQIALTRYPIINNAPNPKYKDPLSQALNRLTVKSALKVYDVMTDDEKAKHATEITKKINNMLLRKDQPPKQQKALIEKWNELKG